MGPLDLTCFLGTTDAGRVIEENYNVILPNVKIADCKKAVIVAKTCLKIVFVHGYSNVVTEYAALNEEEPGINTILSGPLFTSEWVEIENSRVSATLLGEGLDAQVQDLISQLQCCARQMNLCPSGEPMLWRLCLDDLKFLCATT